VRVRMDGLLRSFMRIGHPLGPAPDSYIHTYCALFLDTYSNYIDTCTCVPRYIQYMPIVPSPEHSVITVMAKAGSPG
jgi:hypothetical protein